MSIESLIDTFGKTLYVYAPRYTDGADGSQSRTYDTYTSAVGFVQPTSMTQIVAQDRLEGRTTAVIYFKSGTSVGIDSEIKDDIFGGARRWLVTGVTNPAILNQTGARPDLDMVVVDCIEVTQEDSL